MTAVARGSRESEDSIYSLTEEGAAKAVHSGIYQGGVQEYTSNGNHHDEGEMGEEDSDDEEVANGLRRQEMHRREEEDLEDDRELQDDMDDSGSFSDSLSSSPSIPDEDIDFALVYALHTFLATVDGQASVVKGDKLLLLDDSNSYWWLVRVLKTHAVGYIPAENIETPWERLARLNKHRNVDLTSATQEDHITGPNSTVAQTRFDGRIPPSQQPHPHRSQHPISKGIPASPSHKDHPRNISPGGERPLSRKGKQVVFTAPTYYEHSANGMTDDEYDDEDQGEEQDDELQGDQTFEDENDSEFSEEGGTDEAVVDDRERAQRLTPSDKGPRHQIDEGMEGGDEEDLTEAQWEAERARNQQAQEAQWQTQQDQHRPLSPRQEASLREQQQQREQQRARSPTESDQSPLARSLSPQERYETNQLQRQHEQQQLLQQQHQQRTVSAGGQFNSQPSSLPESQALRRQNSDPTNYQRPPFDSNSPTKKVTASPPIIRDPNFDMNNPYADLPGGVPRSISPVRVHGVEVIDPNDPRYCQLITDRPKDALKASGSNGRATSPIISREDGARKDAGSASKKLKKALQDSMDNEAEKKKKSGGILSGLFRKKDKKKKEKDDADSMEKKENRARQEVNGNGNGNGADSNRRESQTAESMFSTDAALRQQGVEARLAMMNQYGVSREPGDVTNTMVPRQSPAQQQNSALGSFSSAGSPITRRMRPGSLVGSPGMGGAELPLLSVLRVFAGDNIESEATFKTVLLNRLTSSSELVKQSMQRFRLAGLEDRDEYYLTVRELGGEERPLEEHEKPLIVFQSLADSINIPSVKRSSVGSIDSVASGLSMNPAITRLGMNDFTDDSAVKFYLNRLNPTTSLSPRPSYDHDSPSLPMNGRFDAIGSAASPSYRFAVRLLIYSDDLPDNVVFDPQSNAIIPKQVLAERQSRSGVDVAIGRAVSEAREKIIFFPRNVNVSEVIEAALDRFGIVDGIVDGGDEVEDRISNRRSVSRVKYGLALRADGRESPLSLLSRVIDAYRISPLLKPYDRTSKEFRRRSVDATLILGSSEDILPSDPIFIIRRAATSRQIAPGPRAPLDELALHQHQQQHSDPLPRPPPVSRTGTLSSTAGSVYATPMEEFVDPIQSQSGPALTPQEIIAAQRAGAREKQRVVLTAQKNSDYGVDVTLSNRETIRSSRISFDDERVRYSYIDEEGSETDISEIVEAEWATAVTDKGSVSRASRISTTGVGSSGTISRPLSTADEESDAVDALRRAPVAIDGADYAGFTPIHRSTSISSSILQSADVLEDALTERTVLSPRFGETLEERLVRVLARAKQRKAKDPSSSPSSSSRPRSRQDGARSVTPSYAARTSPTTIAHPPIRPSPTGTLLDQRGSPFPEIDRSSPIVNRLARSLNSSTKSTTTVNGDSVNSNRSRISNRKTSGTIVYHDDFGLETLLTLVEGDSSRTRVKRKKIEPVDKLFGREVKDLDVHKDVKELFADKARTHDALESRLDALLRSFLK